MSLRTALLFLLALSSMLASAHRDKPQEDQDVMRPNPAAATPDASALASCPAGSPLGEMELKVKTSSSAEPLPFVNIVHLSEGDTVEYTPLGRGREKREGEVALVLVPAKISGPAKGSGKDQLIVTEVRDAEKPQHWEIPRTTALVVFVYGPQGLSKKKVKNFLSQDSSLVAQMADFADKTAQTEALLQALSNAETTSASMNAALTGFASQYGVAVQLDKTAPPNVQAQALFQAINPQLASYSPLASSSASRTSQTASLATTAASLFFGSSVGVLAGGTSMLLELRSIAFPDTQFRSAFSQVTRDARLNLCGERSPTPPHTRVAYGWATRIPNAPTPKMRIGDAHYIAEGQKSPVATDLSDPIWKYLQRARLWTLENDRHERTDIPLLKLQNQKAVELDLAKAKVKPGTYHLAGYWDWARFTVEGEVVVLPLGDFHEAQLKPESQDRLLANGGKEPVTLRGGDFEFVTKVEIKKSGDAFAVAEPARYILPKGPRLGPQKEIAVQVNTHDLEPGRYQLLLSQSDGKAYSVQFQILPNPPKVSNFPVIANEGVTTQHYVLKGERLDSIAKLDAAGVTFELGGTSAGNTERNVTVQVTSGAKAGSAMPVKAYLKDRSEPLLFENALRITGPLPVIASSKLSPSGGVSVKLKGDEFPAGSTLSAMLDVKNIDRTSTLILSCAEGVGQSASLQIGQQSAASNLQQVSPDQLFLSFDTGSLPAGCSLQAVVAKGKEGSSSPFALAHLIRVPQVESVQPAGEPPVAGQLKVRVRGQGLEMVDKLGWDGTTGAPPVDIPTPVPGAGQKQELHVMLPEAHAPDAPLYLWLRGDSEGRETAIKLLPPPETGPGAASAIKHGPGIP